MPAAAGGPMNYLAGGLLPAGHGALGTLTGTRVGLRALPTHGQAAAVAQPLVGADLHLAADIRGYLAAQVTFELVVRLQVVTQGHHLGVAEVPDAYIGAESGGLDGFLGAGAAHAVDVGQGDLESLVAGDVGADESCHGLSPLP